MALAIRLSRQGRKNRPFYRIVVADKRMPRDGRYIERLGTYNPLLPDDQERVKLVEERIKYWLSEGAKPSERVSIFLGKAGITDMPTQPNRPNKAKPSEKTLLRIEDKKERVAKAKEAAEEAAKAPPPPEEAPAEEAKEESPAPEEKAEEKAEEKPDETPAEEKSEEAPAKEKPAEEPKESTSAEATADKEEKKED